MPAYAVLYHIHFQVLVKLDENNNVKLAINATKKKFMDNDFSAVYEQIIVMNCNTISKRKCIREFSVVGQQLYAACDKQTFSIFRC